MSQTCPDVWHAICSLELVHAVSPLRGSEARHEQVRQENLSMARMRMCDADAPRRNLVRDVLEREG